MGEQEIIPTAAAVITDQEHILLVTHGEQAGHITGMKGLPSGRVEGDETEAQTVVREIKEETNLNVNPEDLEEFEGNYFTARIPRKDGTERVYGGRVFRINAYTGEIMGNEETTPEWATMEEVTSLDSEGLLLPNVKTAIENALK